LIENITDDYQNVKRLSREYENLTRHLIRHLPALPPDQISNIDEELKQIHGWKRYIAWEKKNPLKLESFEMLKKRVMFAYEQSFSCLGYHCDLWYEAGAYLHRQSQYLSEDQNNSNLQKEIEAETGYLYERAVNTYMRNNLLIHLIYADFKELRGDFKKCYEIYENCLQPEYSEFMDATLTWIHYIRFVRRNEDITAARRLFKRAREDPRSTYHLFIANAYLEYFSTKDKATGFRIFQFGTKKFAKIPEYMLAYINYMSHLNEDNNTRVLFERILSSDELPVQSTNEIWSEFLKFECAVGDLASILKVDKKRQKVFESMQNGELNECTLMVDRYKYFDLLPCNQNELKAIGYKDIPVKLATVSSSGQQSSINNLLISPDEFSFSAVNEAKKLKYPVPDSSQMLPYKPVIIINQKSNNMYKIYFF
jgi:cleavage stimulation factor subunit 3